MSIQGVATTCDIFRSFGGSLISSGTNCVLTPDLACGRGLEGYMVWSHYVDLPVATDIQDGCSRSSGNDNLEYTDGDEVRFASTDGRFVVVFVAGKVVLDSGTVLRAYLLRS